MAISFFSPKTQFENLGDALINGELIELISENSEVIIDSSRSPKGFIDNLKVNPDKKLQVMNSNFLLFLIKLISSRLIKRLDCYYFLSPGGYVGELSVFQFIQQLFNNTLLSFLSIIGVKICLVGVSYERLGNRYINILKFRSKLLHIHLVRDNITKKYLKAKSIRITGTCPDLAFSIFRNKPKPPHPTKSVVLSFRTDQDPQQLECIDKFLYSIKGELEKASRIRLYCQVDRDLDGLNALAIKLSSNLKNVDTSVIKVNSLDKALDVFKGGHIVISNRLHVLLLAASQNCKIYPCFYKGFNQKLIGLFSDNLSKESVLVNLESPELYIDYSENTVNKLETTSTSKVLSDLRINFKNIYV